MDAYQAIIGKRDRRDYDSRPIPEDVLQRILQAGRMAGSSSNSQPFRFVVMREQASKEKLAPAGPGTAPLVRDSNGRKELLIPVRLTGGRADVVQQMEW